MHTIVLLCMDAMSGWKATYMTARRVNLPYEANIDPDPQRYSDVGKAARLDSNFRASMVASR